MLQSNRPLQPPPRPLKDTIEGGDAAQVGVLFVY